jgi:hypothetical protein
MQTYDYLNNHFCGRKLIATRGVKAQVMEKLALVITVLFASVPANPTTYTYDVTCALGFSVCFRYRFGAWQ